MKKKVIKSMLLAMTLAMFGLTSNAQSGEKVKVTLKVSNVSNPTATIHVGFYMRENKFPTQQMHAFAKEFVPGKTGDVSVTWDNIPEGEYALAVYQDIDNSGKMKSNIFGYPQEPFAFSQNFRPKMSKPKFDQCKITVSTTSNIFELKLID